MIKEDCIFCKLANGIFASATVYEDENFRAILDINPSVKGHTIILPKNHMENLLTADEATLSKALSFTKKIANAVKITMKADGINVLQNNGEAAGQSVFHLHFHVIPRYNDDNFIIPWKQGKYSDKEADALAAEIASNIEK